MGRRLLYEVRPDSVLRVCDKLGRHLVDLRGHDEWIVGLIADEAEERAVTWDRSGCLCWWDLRGLPEGQGPSRVQARGGFDWDWPAAVQARRDAALPRDPSTGAQQLRIAELRDDTAALRRYAWSLPASVDASVDQALTAALGDWRPTKKVEGDTVNRWLKRSHDVRASERSSAAWAFGFAGWEGLAGVARLVDLLADLDVSVGERAAQSLDSVGHHALPAAAALVANLDRFHDFGQRHAVSALKAIGGPAAGDVAVLLAHKKSAMRTIGAQILASMGPAAAPALPGLIGASGDKRSKGVRAAACAALGAVGDPAALPALTDRIQDKQPEIQRAALRAIGAIGDARALPAVQAALGSGDRWLRQAALAALAGIGDPAGCAYAVAALGAAEWRERAAAFVALRSLGDASALPALKALRADPAHAGDADLGLRLFELGEPGAGLAHLIAGLRHPTVWRIDACAAALASLGPSALTAAPALREALATRGGAGDSAIVRALGAIGDRASLPQLIALTRSSERALRRAGVKGLGLLRFEGARPALLQAAQRDEAPRVRLEAALGLHGMDGDEAALVERLAAIIRRCDVGVTREATEALTALTALTAPGPAAVAAEPALRVALRHTHQWVWLPAEAALLALGLDPYGAPRAGP